MNWIKSKVESLYKKYGTRNPFELAEYLNIHVIFYDLHDDIKGFYQYHKRNRFIYLNSNLGEAEVFFVCGHEVGHAVLHTDSSTPFMRKHTLFSINKIEREANIFAAELLIPDEALHCTEQPTANDIAALYNVPVELVKLKFK